MPQTLFTQVCHQHIAMAIGCFKSLEKAWQQAWTLHVVEDGTVTPADWDELRTAFPMAVFHRKNEIKGHIEEMLSKYPACLSFYRSDVLAAKLFEAPLLSIADCHYCDTDLLFFRRFHRLWPESPGPIFLGEEYAFSGYSHSIFDWAVRYRIPLAQNLSGGMYRVPKHFHDLDKIEWFLKRSQHPLRPFLVEQTCWAFLAASGPHRLLSPEEIVSARKGLPTESFPPAIHFIGAQKSHFCQCVSRVDRALKREPINEIHTVEGRRMPWVRVARQIGVGLKRRLAESIGVKA